MSLNVFFKRLLGLFTGKPSCSTLVRSARFLANYNAWLKAGLQHHLTASFGKAYHFKKCGIKSNYRVQLIKEQNREGVILFYDPSIPVMHFHFLFEYLKDKALESNYKLHSSDKRKLIHDRYTQLIEAYYLTPAPSDVPGTTMCNQLYGNIKIDYTLINKHPGYIRLITDTYSDPHFSRPLPFSELFSALFPSTQL